MFNYSILIDPLLQSIRVYTPKFSGMKKGDRVLDVCCGTGDQVFYYGKEGLIAHGIDLNPKMIKTAEKRKKESGLTNIFFQIADAKKLPFQNNYFDFVSISLALHEKDKHSKNKIISEMKRVVKNKGFLIFIDFQVPLPQNIYSYLVRFIEYFAGKNHYKYFKDYLLQGGLPILLAGNKLKEEKTDYLLNNLITIIKTKNIKI